METIQFYDIVKRMRQAQKEYTKTNDKRILQRVKCLEGVVDNMIDEHDDELRARPYQFSLFDDQQWTARDRNWARIKLRHRLPKGRRGER